MRITTKFVGSSVLLIVLTAILSGSSYFINRENGKSLDASYARSQAMVDNTVDLSFGLQGQVTALSRLSVLADSQEEIDRYSLSRQNFLKALDSLEKVLPPEDQLSLVRLNGIRQQHQYLETLAQRLLSEAADNQALESTAEGNAIDIDRLEEITRSLRLFENQSDHYIKALLKSAQAQTAVYSQQQQATRRQTVLLETLSFSLVLLLLLVQFYGLLRPMLRSLHQLQSGAKSIGESAQSAQLSVENGSANTGPANTGPANTGSVSEPFAALPTIHLNTQDELQSVADAFNQMSDRLAAAYHQLESKVTERTASLNHSNQLLLEEVNDRIKTEKELSKAIRQLKQAQLQLLQTEKLSSLNQLVAGVAHEINNPVSFIQGNLSPAQSYMDSLLTLIKHYQAECPEASDELQAAVEDADLDFIQTDFPQLLASISNGADRITTIVRSLKTFSHMDESATKAVDLHQGLESALLILSAKLNAAPEQSAISIVRNYGDLPKVYCYPSQLNQAFMSLLTNAIDAIHERNETNAAVSCLREPTIQITTEADADCVRIAISDNGMGMPDEIRQQVFDPFFTTKPVGAGTGLGLSMCYQIVTGNHQGRLTYDSEQGLGTTVTIEIPLSLKIQRKAPITVAELGLQPALSL